MCKLFWAADTPMDTKEFEDALFSLKNKIFGVKLNSLYHHLQAVYPQYLLYEYSTTFYNIPLLLDLKLYDTPRTIQATIEALPNFDYITITFAHDNFMSISSAVETAAKRSAMCFIVFGLTTSRPMDEQYFLSKVAYMAEIYDEIGFVVPGDKLKLIPKIKKLNSHILTLTPGIRPMHSVSYGDQLVTTSIEEIDAFGGDFGVVGRAILNPVKKFFF